MALHQLFQPDRTIIKGSTWTPTVLMSEQSFLKTVNGHFYMKEEMAKRIKFCKENGINSHPVIFEIITCLGTRYHVCIENVCYKVESLMVGVDVAYKIYKTLNIDFPPESKKVWKFISYIFYGENDVDISGKFLSLVEDLNQK